MSDFAGAMAVLGTRHGKGPAIAAPLEAGLGLTVEVVDDVDTDRFGTFTREVPRLASPRETARAKALAALELHARARLGLSSEGSFGPHPQVPFVVAGVELVYLVDRSTGLELVGRDVTTETNFDARAVSSIEDALTFAVACRFPSHGLIVMPSREGRPLPADGVVKGIVEEGTLRTTVAATLRTHGEAWIEADMRAHLNPTRMKSIERAAHDLVVTARSSCPACGRAGYVVVERVPGLPCEDCGLPTGRARAEALVCSGCGHREERPVPGAPKAVTAHFCERCNP